MILTKIQLENMLKTAADTIIKYADELTEIDSKFGDADHGVTMIKISQKIKNAIKPEEKTMKSMLGEIANQVMMLNGGSAVPLWSTFLEGLAKGAPDSESMNEAELKKMFQTGYEELNVLSGAKVGDKTMMDTLIPAVESISRSGGTVIEIMEQGCLAAKEGAENSKNYVAKFGRARSYKEQTIGTPDAGAVSMKYFFVGLYEGCKDLLDH